VEALAWALAWVLAWAEAWVAPVSADRTAASCTCRAASSPRTFPPTCRRTRADWFLEQGHSSERTAPAWVLAWVDIALRSLPRALGPTHTRCTLLRSRSMPSCRHCMMRPGTQPCPNMPLRTPRPTPSCRSSRRPSLLLAFPCNGGPLASWGEPLSSSPPGGPPNRASSPSPSAGSPRTM